MHVRGAYISINITFYYICIHITKIVFTLYVMVLRTFRHREGIIIKFFILHSTVILILRMFLSKQSISCSIYYSIKKFLARILKHFEPFLSRIYKVQFHVYITDIKYRGPFEAIRRSLPIHKAIQTGEDIKSPQIDQHKVE